MPGDSVDLKEFALFESFEEPFFVMDSDGTILYTNQRFSERFQKRSENLVGHNLMQRTSVRPLNLALDADWETMGNEVIQAGGRRAFERDLEDQSLKYTIYPYRSSRLLVIIQDITEQKRFARNAEQGQALLKALVNTIPASVIIIDAEMRLVGWNQFSQDTINGKSESEMRAAGINPFQRIHPDDLYEVKRTFLNILNFDIEDSVEFRMFHQNGPPYVWATARGKKVIIENKPCVVTVVTETTELFTAEDRRKLQEDKLRQAPKMELLGQLAGGIAHDFNNSLTAILVNTEILLEKLDPSLPFIENIRDIRKAALQSAEMTRKILNFVREQGTDAEPLVVDTIIDNHLQVLQRTLGANILLKWKPGLNDHMVRMVPGQLEQIVSNLCINSRDAISGPGTITVTTKARRIGNQAASALHPAMTAGNYIILSVTDTGCGIDADRLPHIFEPVFSAGKPGEGNGLGLAMVHGILQQNYGHIECTSKPGKGSTFTIYLPEYRQEAIPEPVTPEIAGTCSKGQATILLVEDEVNILKFIKEVLEDKGFAVLTAQDAETACRIADRQRDGIDLLITDIILPKMNGVQLSWKLQAERPEMKVLFMSGYAPETVSEQRIFREGVDFIQKPFGLQDFMKIVQQALCAIN